MVPGYYGTYWVKHLNEITIVDTVFDGFWMKTAYRIPDNDCHCVEPGTAPKATIPINRFNVRSFITNIADGAKVKAGSTALKGIAFDGGSGIKDVAVSTDGGKTWAAGQAGQGSRQIFLPRMESAGEARGRRPRTESSRDRQ